MLILKTKVDLKESLFQLNEIALNQINFQLIYKILDELIKQEEEIGNIEKVKSLKKEKNKYLTINKAEDEDLLSNSFSSISSIL